MRRGTAHSDYLPACDGKFWPADPFTAQLVCHKDLNTENLNKLRYVYES